MIYMSLDIDTADPMEKPEFTFETMEEASVFMGICFKSGFGITAYQVNE